MRDFINVFIVIVICGLAVGVTYVQVNNPDKPFGILYIPLFIWGCFWGYKLMDDY